MVEHVRALEMRKRLQNVVRDCCGGEMMGSLILSEPGRGLLELAIQFNLGIDVIDQ